MKYQKLVFLICLLPIFLFGQIVENGGFESPELPTQPDDLSQIDLADAWEEALDSNSPFGPHTADWLSTCEADHISVWEQPFTAPGPGNYAPISANSGCKYGGMLAGELFQQDIGDFVDGEHLSIKVSMYIRLPFQWHFSNTPEFTRTPLFSEGMTLDFYMAKSKITYDNENAQCNAPDGEGYEKRGNKLIKLKSVPLSTSKYPQGEWHLIEASFPAGSVSHNWLAFEFVTPAEGTDDCRLDYIMIDDVSIEVTDCHSCFNCTPYDGCIEYNVLNDAHGIDHPLTFTGLHNVDWFKFHLVHENGFLIRTIEINNCPQVVSWDGKDSGGTEIPAAPYFVVLELANSCQYIKDEFTFIKSNAYTENTIPNSTTMNYQPVLTQDFNDECCYDCLELTSNNIAYLNPPTNLAEAEELVNPTPIIDGVLNLVAIDKIVVDDAINIQFLPTSSVTFQSSQEILIKEGTNVTFWEGADISCIIDDYSSGFLPPPEDRFSKPKNQFSNFFKERKAPVNRRDSTSYNSFVGSNSLVDKSGEFQLEIYPNPSDSGIFTLSCRGSFSEDLIINVKDLLGRTISKIILPAYQTSGIVDISDMPNGVYYISMNHDPIQIVKKIVKDE